jgi:hypothetical protein
MEKKETKSFNLNMKQCNRYLSDFINYKENFKMINNGSSVVIECRGITWRFIDYGGVSGRGYHLSKFVHDDARNFLGNNPTISKVKSENGDILTDNVDLEVQKANRNGIKKYLGEQIYCVDVNNCYWDTAYKMGFISQVTYLRGLKKKEWKIGRNASIGSLSKVVVETNFINGIRAESTIIKPELDLSIIRDKIVSEVHFSFLEILKKLENDWIMYFTDCIYIPLSRVEEAKAYFKDIGYETKVETYQLDKFNEETLKVNWYDYQKNTDKSFQFSERQFSLTPMPRYSMPSNNNKRISDNTDFLEQ